MMLHIDAGVCSVSFVNELRDTLARHIGGDDAFLVLHNPDGREKILRLGVKVDTCAALLLEISSLVHVE